MVLHYVCSDNGAMGGVPVRNMGQENNDNNSQKGKIPFGCFYFAENYGGKSMRLFYRDEREIPTPEQINQAYPSVPDPSKISGYASFFFMLDDIYLVGKLEEAYYDKPSIEKELQEMIKRYNNDDYGEVSKDEESANLENRWMWGSCKWTIARYYLSDGRKVVLEFLYDMGFLYFEGDKAMDVIARVQKYKLEKGR